MPVQGRNRLKLVAPAFLRLALLAVLAAIAGALFGVSVGLAVAVVGLLILMFLHLTYASLLAAWLEKPRLDDLPNG